MSPYDLNHWTTWAKDIFIGLGFIATTVGSMWGLGQLADFCTQIGICA